MVDDLLGAALLVLSVQFLQIQPAPKGVLSVRFLKFRDLKWGETVVEIVNTK